MVTFIQFLGTCLTVFCPAGEVPADFKVVAGFACGATTWKTWTTTIQADGQALQDVHGNEKKLKLSAKQLDELVRVIVNSKYSELKPAYRGSGEDKTCISLKITMNKTTHEVLFLAPEQFVEEKNFDVFIRIWDEVLSRVPSPNDGQTAGHYRRED